MKKNNNERQIVIAAILMGVLFYAIGSARSETINFFAWGWGSKTFVCVSWLLSVLGVIALKILTRLTAIGIGIMIGMFVISGFWGLLYHFILPRIF